MSEEVRNPKDWSLELGSIERLCAVRNMTSTRLFQLLDRDLPMGHFAGGKNLPNQTAAKEFNWRRYANGAPIYRLVPVNGRYMVIPAHLNNELIVPLVADAIDADTDAVVELGCGYGRLLFALRDILEHQWPKLRYFGGELSGSGLAAARRVAALEPERAAITFHKFDYLNPDLSFVAGCKKVVFFTCHSIEQVQEIQDILILRMCDVASQVQCIHAEPVGWQLNAQAIEKTAKGAFDHSLHLRPSNDVDDFFSALVSTKSQWNRNLLPVLQKVALGGKIILEPPEINACGNDTYNPTTLVYWSKPASADQISN